VLSIRWLPLATHEKHDKDPSMGASEFKRIARKLLALYMAVVISIAAVLTVSVVLVLPAYVVGHADMDITFDIREPGGPGNRDGSAVYGLNEAKGITCNDASAEMADGKWWIRCRYVADKVSYATDYLRANGLEVGGTYTRIVMQPAGGSWISLVCAALLVACLGLVWSWRDASRLRRELVWIAGNKGRSVLAVVAPGVVTMVAAALSTWMLGSATAPQMPPLRHEYMVAMFMTIVVTAPLVEELLYRGVLFDLLVKRSTAVVAACLGTVIFVGAHVGAEFWKIDPVRVTALGMGSLALYAVRFRTGSLLLCIVGHMLLNLFVFSVYSASAMD